MSSHDSHEDNNDDELAELKAITEKNADALQKLRNLLENLEVLLGSLNAAVEPKPKSSKERDEESS